MHQGYAAGCRQLHYMHASTGLQAQTNVANSVHTSVRIATRDAGEPVD